MGYGNLVDKLDKHIDVIGLIHIADAPAATNPAPARLTTETSTASWRS
jgi:hypothetical protein